MTNKIISLLCFLAINLRPLESLIIFLLNGATVVRNMHLWDEQQEQRKKKVVWHWLRRFGRSFMGAPTYSALLLIPHIHIQSPPFVFRTALILHGIDSYIQQAVGTIPLKVSIHIDMLVSCSCCRFVGCASVMRISCSTASQRCSIGLRSGDCGGHLSPVNSMSCSRN